MNRFVYALFLVTCIVGCDKEDDFVCDRNSKATLLGNTKCYTGTAKYGNGSDALGNPKEDFELGFREVNGGWFTVYVNSVPYQPPFTSIGQLKENTDYTVAGNHSNLYIEDIVQLLEGQVRFSKIDRSSRKISGNFSFTYVINTSSGNKNIQLTGDFSEVIY